MKNVIQLLFVAVVMTLVACAPGSNSSSSSEQPVYTESEISSDGKRVDDAISDLRTIGLKLVVTQVAGTTDQYHYDWDREILGAYLQRKSLTAQQYKPLARPRLEKLAKACDDFLLKYTRTFTIKMDDGTVKANQILLEPTRKDVEARSNLAKQTLNR